MTLIAHGVLFIDIDGRLTYKDVKNFATPRIMSAIIKEIGMELGKAGAAEQTKMTWIHDVACSEGERTLIGIKSTKKSTKYVLSALVMTPDSYFQHADDWDYLRFYLVVKTYACCKRGDTSKWIDEPLHQTEDLEEGIYQQRWNENGNYAQLNLTKRDVVEYEGRSRNCNCSGKISNLIDHRE